MSPPGVPYAGIATRGVALAIDALLSQGIFVVGTALFGLIGSLVGDIRPDWIVPVLVAAGWVVTVVCYFVGFWAVAGQTPGMRLMHVRVLANDGAPPRTARGVVRLIGLGLAIIPLFAGFLPVLVDHRRRGLADFLAGTVVVYADREIPLADLRPAISLVERDMTGQSS
jgi:uncharacterized RDD family membrane protein YckC